MIARKSSGEIYRLAAVWAARTDSGRMTQSDGEELMAWRAADPRHDGAYVRALAVLARFDRTQVFSAGQGAQAGYTGDRFLNRRRVLFGGAGAMAASVVGAFGLKYLQTERYTSGRGEVRLFVLPDQSVVHLNSASSVTVRYFKDRRELHLLYGEAMFDVAKQPDRPFIVYAGNIAARAVGTSFSVRRYENAGASVVVREGIVDVGNVSPQPSQGTGPAVRLIANEMAVVDRNDLVHKTALTPGDLSDALAWKDGMLVFKRTRLADAAQEFARYSDTRLVIEDPKLRDKTITGLFSAYDPHGFADAVAISLGARAVVAENGDVVLKE